MDARRLIPVGATVTALLVLVAIASHGRPLTSGRGTGPTATFFDYVATTLVVFAVAMLLVVVVALRGDKAGGGPPRKGPWRIASSFLMLAGAVLLAEWVMHSKFEQRIKQLAQQHPKQQAAVPPSKLHGAPTQLRNARIRWDEIAIVLVVVGGVGVYLFLTREGRKTLRPLTRSRAAVARALDDSLDDLRDDPDIRRAIIAAYARMEHALAVHGIERRPAEAPFEYLARALVELDAAGTAAQHLTDLFERAKFSHHEPAATMRDEAIDALVAVRDELRAPAAEPVTA